MRILLANPPWRKSTGAYGVRAGSRWPFTMSAPGPKDLKYIPFPFFLAYAAALLEKIDGADVLAIDAIAEGLSEEEYRHRVRAFEPQLVVAETSTASFAVDMEHVSWIKGEFSGCMAAIAGPHATSTSRDVLSQYPQVDYCFIGEYEATLQSMVVGILAGSFVPEQCKGIAYRKNGNIVVNPRRALIMLNDLPWPAYHYFPMHNYRDYFCDIPAPMVHMVASRGCPYTCDFCLWPKVMYGGNLYRCRSMYDVADEMEFLIGGYGFRTVYFDDDTFNIGRSRLLMFCNEILRRGIKTNIAMMARADTMDKLTLGKLVEAGLCAAKFGVESGSQQILDACDKKLDLEMVKHTVRFAKELGIRVHLTFTVGLRGETWNTIRQSIDLALELDPYSIQVSIATPFPGTEFYRYAEKNGHLIASGSESFDGNTSCVIRTDELSSQQVEEGFHAFKRAWDDHKERCS